MKERIRILKETIAEELSKRKNQHLSILAVSKTQPIEKIKEASKLGITHFGENKVQELCQKLETLPELDWQFIGRLQRNKVKYLMEKVSLIHSVDNISLAEEIQKRSKTKTNILIEINIADELSKGGISYDQADEFLQQLQAYPMLCVKGLMCIAPYSQNPTANRDHFKRMYEKFATWKSNNHQVEILSMGMSNDYQVAIAEGSTMIRIGHFIFGDRI